MAGTFPKPPPLPREHGAWVMLVLPLLLGLVLGGARPSAGWLLPVAAVAVFLAHYALHPLIARRLSGKASPPEYARRRVVWGVLYLAGGFVTFTAMFAATPASHRGGVLGLSLASAALGAIYAAAATLGAGRLVATELVGMAGMALLAPVVPLAAGRPFAPVQLGAAVVAFVYSASALSFVRAYGALAAGRLRALSSALGAHVALFAVTAWVARDGWLPGWWPALFAPLVIRVLWGIAAPPANLRRLGMRELGFAVVYLALAIALLLS